jgi:hypothetical protein
LAPREPNGCVDSTHQDTPGATEQSTRYPLSINSSTYLSSSAHPPHGDSLAVRQRHRRANLSGTRFSTALWPLDIRLRKEDIDSHPLQAARWAVRSTREDASQFPQPYGKDAASQTSKFGAHRHLVVHKIRRFEVKLLQRCWKRSKKPEFRVVTSLGADQILSPSVSMVIRKKGASSVSCVRDSTRVLAPSSVKCIQQVP